MYVIRDDSDNNIYPADRCVFKSTYNSTTTGYDISAASFYPGNAAAVTIDNPTMGVIGKSGRFTPISNLG
ncbi:MAG: hypothetical protein K0U78_05085 [Actinomycetia bacterium]|nr:hypothetical protein [Actinomycetes bacterium]